jgi:UDP-N-acetylmuramyl pentapeptide synthase
VDALIREDTVRIRKRRFWRVTVTAVAFALLLAMILAVSTFRVRRAVETTKSEVNRWKTLAEERQKKIDELSQELNGRGAKSK